MAAAAELSLVEGVPPQAKKAKVTQKNNKTREKTENDALIFIILLFIVY